MPRLVAGTSGFSYPSWKPAFYPEKLASKKFLSHYATRLNGVELNYTFHRLPSAASLESWLADTAPGFTFCLKAHQRITHFQRLAPGAEFTHVFFKAIDPLRVHQRLGPVLFQLPPNLACDLPRFEAFLKDIPDDIPCAFEFRNKSWFDDAVYKLLESRGIALCLAESDKLVVPEHITAGFVYFRLRKTEYSAEDRAAIAAKAATLVKDGKDVYVFFKHEESPDGALYAEELLQSQQ
ncbi:MAG: DUF72 domain-containing protein [Bryobacterales bacterium]|nr:DUF72 domain-containing protein [Bryobacterales bacterium]